MSQPSQQHQPTNNIGHTKACNDQQCLTSWLILINTVTHTSTHEFLVQNDTQQLHTYTKFTQVSTQHGTFYQSRYLHQHSPNGFTMQVPDCERVAHSSHTGLMSGKAAGQRKRYSSLYMLVQVTVHCNLAWDCCQNLATSLVLCGALGSWFSQPPGTQQVQTKSRCPTETQH